MFKFDRHRPVTPELQVQGLLAELDQLREQVRSLRLRVHELEGQATIDDLVGLPNRRGFIQSLEALIHKVGRYDISAAMIFVDVDGLKRINDDHGHAVGDAALTHVARALLGAVRKSDCVGRLSGDEFGILLERTCEGEAWNMALRVVERVTGAPLLAEGKSLQLSVAVGVGLINAEDSPQEAIKRADEQMYRIKRGSARKVESRIEGR